LPIPFGEPNGGKAQRVASLLFSKSPPARGSHLAAHGKRAYSSSWCALKNRNMITVQWDIPKNGSRTGDSGICAAARSRRGQVRGPQQMLHAIKRLLAHADTRDLTVYDPRTTERRRGIIQSNRFLWRIYDEWYRLICARIPDGPGRVLELGSGAGFLAQYIPAVITSEVFPCPDVQLVADGRRLPFRLAA